MLNLPDLVNLTNLTDATREAEKRAKPSTTKRVAEVLKVHELALLEDLTSAYRLAETLKAKDVSFLEDLPSAYREAEKRAKPKLPACEEFDWTLSMVEELCKCETDNDAKCVAEILIFPELGLLEDLTDAKREADLFSSHPAIVAFAVCHRPKQLRTSGRTFQTERYPCRPPSKNNC